MTHYVSASWLNVRSEPRLRNDNKIVAIPYGHPVEIVSPFNHRWSKITTTYEDQDINGFSATRYLSTENGNSSSVAFTSIGPVHRQEDVPHATPDSRRHWSYPIGAPDRKIRDMTSNATRVESMLDIINYLDVENSERYRPAKYTYCNIYAHDYAYLCGAYLPRCWWNDQALLDLSDGESVSPHYGTTIYEMNANSLYFWLKEWGSQFGWKQYFDLEEVQSLASEGKVCLCSAHNRQSNRSGHIACVIPAHDEHDGMLLDGNYIPLMSQAGRHNRKIFNRKWWTSSRFNFFGFWVHD